MVRDARYPYDLKKALAEAITFLPQCVLGVLVRIILDTYSQVNDVEDDVHWSVIMSRISRGSVDDSGDWVWSDN